MMRLEGVTQVGGESKQAEGGRIGQREIEQS